MSAWTEKRKDESHRAMRDHVAMICKLANLRVKALTKPVRSECVDPKRAGAPDELKIELFRAHEHALAQPIISERNALKIVMRVESAIREAASIVGRKTYIDSYSLKPLSPLKELMYVPRLTDENGEARRWTAPPRIAKGHSAAAAAYQAILPTLTPDKKGSLPVLDVYVAICENLADAGMRALLAEIPHEWGWGDVLPGATGAQEVPAGLMLAIEKAKATRVRKTSAYYLFNAPRRWLNMLDDVLRGKADNAPGSLKIEVAHKINAGGELVQASVHAYLQLPINSQIPDEPADKRFFDRLIGIDLGERGIGFSVRAVEGGKSIAKGFVRIPDVRGLVRAEEDFRKRNMQTLKSNKFTHVSYEDMREAVAGKVVSAIKYLMWHYKGFPVLEHEVGSKNADNKQLNSVYSRVLQIFLFSGVSTSDSMREHMWRGKHVAHPTHGQLIVNRKTGSSAQKALNLFPGTAVSAAGSSQECACCERNATSALRELKEKKLEVQSGGMVELPNGRIQLLAPKKSSKNKRIYVPYEAGIMGVDEVIAAVNLQRRSAPENAASEDTKQSEFRCPYVDCDNFMSVVHADVNAADVLVKRKLRRLELVS